MAGIYIHIPFCRKACNYCDFHFSTSLKYKSELLESMTLEIISRKEELNQEQIQTLYFGGGTPSILSRDEIMLLFDSLESVVTLNHLREITLEANPDDLDNNKLVELKQTPINRLSIGVQSFFDEDLQFMNRSHDVGQAKDSIRNAQDAGFDKITIDLIYGSPSTTDAMWAENLITWDELSINHLSAYCLTVEENTALYHQIKTGKLKPIDEEKGLRQFQYLSDFAQKNNLDHYEISNLSRPHQHAVHNTSYWFGNAYVGIGPSAHSFDGLRTRRINIASNIQYINAQKEQSGYFELEQLSEVNRMNEELITRLRTTWGLSQADFVNQFGLEQWDKLIERAMPAITNNQLTRDNNGLKMPKESWFIADSILVDLMS